MPSASSAQLAASRLPWLIIACGCAIALLTFGPRSAMGFFQLPMLAEKGWDRTTFGLAMAIQNLAWGFGTPVFGALADKFGTGRVLALHNLSGSPQSVRVETGGRDLVSGRAVRGGSLMLEPYQVLWIAESE